MRAAVANGREVDSIQKLGALKQAMSAVGRAMSETQGGLAYLTPDFVTCTAATAFRLLAAVEHGAIMSTQRLRDRLPPQCVFQRYYPLGPR